MSAGVQGVASGAIHSNSEQPAPDHAHMLKQSQHCRAKNMTGGLAYNLQRTSLLLQANQNPLDADRRFGGEEAARQWAALEKRMAPLQQGAALFPAAALRNDAGETHSWHRQVPASHGHCCSPWPLSSQNFGVKTPVSLGGEGAALVPADAVPAHQCWGQWSSAELREGPRAACRQPTPHQATRATFAALFRSLLGTRVA